MNAPVTKWCETAQRAVVDFLASPAAHGGVVPQHVVTHISHVFLAGETAFKLKRAVALPFLDYSTPALRERFCREEVAVNRRFAPELYRGVRAVTESADGLALDGRGPAVDWVVEMNRFAPGAQFDIMLDRGRIDGALIDAVADMIAATHQAAPVVTVGDHSRRVCDLRRQLDRDVTPLLEACVDRANAALWLHKAVEQTLRHRALLDRRGRHGFVRRCHADLHLSNICLWQGRPLAFDAIEFSEEMATIDVLYDLAFVLVDLEHHGRRDFAARLTSRYLERTRDYGGLAVLPLFKANRAMVRALVALEKGRNPAAHLAEARRNAEREPAPRLIAIGGLSGSGKTTVARALAADAAVAEAAEAAAVVIRSDSVHKQLFGYAPEERLPASAYTPAAHEAVYRRMLTDARRALASGWPVILDATFIDPGWRQRARDLARAARVPFAGLWLDAAPDALKARVAARTGDASDADAAVVEAQGRADLGTLDWRRIDAAGDPAAVVAGAKRALEPA